MSRDKLTQTENARIKKQYQGGYRDTIVELQKKRSESKKKEVVGMERNSDLRELIGDTLFIAEIKKAQKFRDTFCNRRRMLETASL